MCDLVNHEEDFGIKAEWHTHATAHRKGACDGIGAIFKREATRASLQAKPTEALLTPESLFKWAESKFQGIKLFYYSAATHKKMQRHLNKRFTDAPAVKNIQSSHGFIVKPNKRLRVLQYSSATTSNNIVYYK